MPTCPCKYSKCISKVHQVATPTNKTTRTHWTVSNRHKGNKEAYDPIDDFIHRLKENIGEPIVTRYSREITGITTRYEDGEKVFLPHHNLKHCYYTQYGFELGSIFTNKIGMTIYTTSSEYEPIPFDAAWPEVSTRLDCLRYTAFWLCQSDKFTKLMIESKTLNVCDACYIFFNY